MVETDNKSLLESKLKEFKELSSLRDNNWVFDEKDKNLSIYKRAVKGAAHSMMAASTSIDIDSNKFLSVLLNDAYMLEVDDSKKERKTYKTEKLNDSTTLYYSYQRGAGKLIVDPRDFVSCTLVSESSDEIYAVTTSIEDKDYPPIKGAVRAEVIMQGWRLSKNGANTDVVFLIHMDPKGSVPATVVGVGVKKTLKLINKVSEYIKKKKL